MLLEDERNDSDHLRNVKQRTAKALTLERAASHRQPQSSFVDRLHPKTTPAAHHHE